LAVQIQAFMRRRPRAEDRHAAVVTALALVLAEYECLDVVASGDPTRGGFSLVVGALAAASVGLALPVLLGPEDESMAREPGEPEPRPLNWKGLVAWAILLLATRSRRR
jgi:hypothetical protein